MIRLAISVLFTMLTSRSSGYRRGSPLVEESILLGLALFAFMILAAVIFDIVEFAQNIFSGVSDGLDKFPTP